MKRLSFRFPILCVIIAMLFGNPVVLSADTPFTITDNNVGYYNIVLSDNATEIEETAANELQDYIHAVTGVVLPIVGESGAQDKSFMVGPTAFAETNEVTPEGPEEWAIKSVGNKIIVTGGRPRGTLYAVYHLLEEQIGIRWWNHWEEYVPNEPTLTIGNPLDLSGEPAFAYREIFDATEFSTETPAYSLFNVRNRLNGRSNNDRNTPAEYGGDESYGKPAHVHTFNRIMPPEVYYDEHPEYYALVDSERQRNGQLCLANEDVKDIFVATILDNIEASYDEADLLGLPRPIRYSISPNDAPGFCEDMADLAQRSTYGDSGYLLNFVNDVAAEIALVYPEVKIDTLAYWYFVDPPLNNVEPDSNVQIRYANVDMDILHPLSHANNADIRAKLEDWLDITSNDLIYWNYAVNYTPNVPMPTMYNKKADYQYLLGEGVAGIFEEQEGTNHTDMWDMKVWIEAKLMENPDLNLNTLITDFTDKYYGAAGSYIRDYLEDSKDLAYATNNEITYGSGAAQYDYFTLDFVNEQTETLDDAATAVVADPVLLHRVNMVRTSLDRLILIRWNELSDESQTESVPMVFDKRESAERLRDTLLQQQESRRLGTGNVEQDYNAKAVDDELLKLLMPAEIQSIPYNTMIDIPSENLNLFNAYGGLTQVTDDSAMLGHAARVRIDDITDPTFRDQHEPPVLMGLYNSTDGTRLLRQLTTGDIVPDQYKLYKLSSVDIKEDDYLYLFGSWSVKLLNLDGYVSGNPAQTYDIYVSMKFQGSMFGGSALDDDAAYIDRVILVGKGELPTELSSVPLDSMTEFSPESFFFLTSYNAMWRMEERASLTGRTLKVGTASMPTEADRDHHLLPVQFGLYNPIDSARFIGQIGLSDVELDEYKLYKIERVHIRPNDYIYMFDSWSVQVQLNAALNGNPDQLYDIYLSMKFEGPAYGGDLSKKDAVYLDRVFVVESDNNWTFTSTAEGWTSGNDISGFGWQSGGYIGGTVTGPQPYIYSPDNLGLDISTNKKIQIRMKNSTTSTMGQFFFITDADTTWNDAKHKDFTITASDPNYTTYTVDMSSVAGWTGTLKQLRLDPEDAVASGSFSVDYIVIIVD